MLGGIDAGGLDVGHQLAGGGQQAVADLGLYQREAAGRVHQEGVDRSAACGPERSRPESRRLPPRRCLLSTSSEPSR